MGEGLTADHYADEDYVSRRVWRDDEKGKRWVILPPAKANQGDFWTGSNRRIEVAN